MIDYLTIILVIVVLTIYSKSLTVWLKNAAHDNIAKEFFFIKAKKKKNRYYLLLRYSSISSYKGEVMVFSIDSSRL